MTTITHRRRFLAVIAGALATSVLAYSYLAFSLTGVAMDATRTQELVTMLNLALMVLDCPHKFRLMTSPYYVQPRPIDLWNNFVVDFWPDDKFVANFRITRASFNAIVGHLGTALEGIPTKLRQPLEPARKAAISLYKLANGGSYDNVELLFGVAAGTACKVYGQFCAAVVSRMRGLVCFPSPSQLKVIASEFSAHGMIGCVGSIDGTQVSIQQPSLLFYEDYFCVRKDHYTMNTQLTCDYYGYFYDVYGCWPGSVHDSRILSASSLHRRAEEGVFNGAEGSTVVVDGVTITPYLVGDSGYGLHSWLLTPYDQERTDAHKAFNAMLRSVRGCVERAFGRLKARFRCLLCVLKHDTILCRDTILTCILLHNWCMMYADGVRVDQLFDGLGHGDLRLLPRDSAQDTAQPQLGRTGRVVGASEKREVLARWFLRNRKDLQERLMFLRSLEHKRRLDLVLDATSKRLRMAIV